jgi:hypothetical protein
MPASNVSRETDMASPVLPGRNRRWPYTSFYSDEPLMAISETRT